jgi:hypothetical protein
MFLIVFISILSDELTREQAWHAFEKSVNNLQKGTLSLELIRHARVFSTAPKTNHDNHEVLLNEASRLGRRDWAIFFGRAIRDWNITHP